MKIWHHTFTITLLLSAVQAQAISLTTVTIDQNGLPLKLVIDPQKTLEIEGLPIQARLFYNTRTGTLFAHLPGEKVTYSLTMGTYGHRVPQAKLEGGAEWQPYEGVPSRYWQVKIGTQTCSHVYANRLAAKQADIDFTDISGLQTGLAYLLGPAAEGACGPYLIGRAHGHIAGLPLYSVSTDGNSEIIDITASEGDYNRLPTATTEPLDSAAHARFLKLMLKPEELAAFEHANGQLPWGQQVKALKNLLLIKAQQARPAN